VSFWRQILLSVATGTVSVGFALISREIGFVSEVGFEFAISVGAFLLMLTLGRLYFRFMWFATKSNESNLYGGKIGTNIRGNRFARWFMGINENGA
jgi:hypothetical protein